MPSFQVEGVCYPSALQAVQAIAARSAGSVVSTGSRAFSLNASTVTDSSITWSKTDLSNGAVTQSTVSITPVPCLLLTAEDGAVISGAIGGVWLTVALILFYRRSLHA